MIYTLPNGTTFTLTNGTTSITVNYGTATITPAGVRLSQGDVVQVHGSFSAGTFTASLINREDLEDAEFEPSEGQEFEVEGHISGFSAHPGEFQVYGRTVRTTLSTRFEGGSSADLDNSVKVEAEGHLNIGVLVADKIKFKRAQVRIEALATAVDMVARTVLVMGKTVQVNDLTRLDDALNNLSPVDEVRELLGDEYDAIVGDDPAGRQYAEMLAFSRKDPSVAELLKDKKLTAASRKKLPKSVFCKPPDGYPVNDCGHAKSAMAYAKKNNESSSVVACIRRKAARLGCPFSDEQIDAMDKGQFVSDSFDTFSDDELRQMFNGLKFVLVERKLLNDEEFKGNQETEALKKDNLRLQEEITQLEDALVKSNSRYKDAVVARTLDFAHLSGQDVEKTKQLSDELKVKPLEECVKTLEISASLLT